MTQCGSYAEGNTDLAWTRLTPWRALLAAALDQVDTRVTGIRIAAEKVSPSADLLGAWLADRLKAPLERRKSDGPGITEVTLTSRLGDISLTRPDGRLATLTVPGAPDRPVALRRREVPELLSEELRRLDPDDIYAATIKRLRKMTARRAAERGRRRESWGGRGRGGGEGLVTVLRHDTDDEVAAAVASALVSALADVQATGREPSVVLTGGTIARKVHTAVADHPDRERVDWGGVHVWWGDERFVAADDDERNEGQARADLVDRLPFDPAKVHAVAADDGTSSVEDAAQAYAAELETVLGGRGGGPWFDVLVLGIGPDGHCASLFPGRPEVDATGLTVAVHDSPKPPPLRVSLTMPTLQRARQVWFVAAGEGKADAVARSVAGGDVHETPSAGPRGADGTQWYVDGAAASRLDG